MTPQLRVPPESCDTWEVYNAVELELLQKRRPSDCGSSFKDDDCILISFYIAKDTPIQNRLDLLLKEKFTADDIPHRYIRESIKSSLKYTITHIRDEEGQKRIKETGMIIFARTSVKEQWDQGDHTMIVIIAGSERLRKAVNINLYRCDSRFYTEPLKEFLKL